ncbi:MAG TPA: hypothetical protein VH019_01155 [Rhizomicrobium sp.]|jgi:hypothetical protein|nr:hypothetical protein [Rhizomicrobium sp.]
MADKSNTSLVTLVMREFCLLLIAVLFASIPFFAVQAQENPTTSSAPLQFASNGAMQSATGHAPARCQRDLS